MKKKVIFVGGTAFSGTTFFHMVLANDPKGFSCGEIRWLFNPHKPHHVNRLCGCGDTNCDLWRKVLRNGEENLFATIFEQKPEVEFIVDSSKSPFWIRSRSDRLQKQGIETENILIWKTPLEFAESVQKRNIKATWDTEWINYHRLYFSMAPQWKAVPYSALTQDPVVLQRTCEYLKIPYFARKERYWERTHHIFGGNRSARFHLYEGERAKQELFDTDMDKERLHHHRSIYYKGVQDSALIRQVEQSMQKHTYFAPILARLDKQSVLNLSAGVVDTADIQFSQTILQLRRLKYALMTQLGRYKYGRQIQR